MLQFWQRAPPRQSIYFIIYTAPRTIQNVINDMSICGVKDSTFLYVFCIHSHVYQVNTGNNVVVITLSLSVFTEALNIALTTHHNNLGMTFQGHLTLDHRWWQIIIWLMQDFLFTDDITVPSNHIICISNQHPMTSAKWPWITLKDSLYDFLLIVGTEWSLL